MGDFKRGLRSEAGLSLKTLVQSPSAHPWKDLLALWEPSGSAQKPEALRLALRQNYLNFYFMGQSVARVSFDRLHQPVITTHTKYAFDDVEGTNYVQLETGGLRHPQTQVLHPYVGPSTIKEWIQRAAGYAGIEKRSVEGIIAQNSEIIDLEMGLPASGGQQVAQRIDYIALERRGHEIFIVFWEAKRIDDKRLRSNTEAEVVTQLRVYENYLKDPHHAVMVAQAYTHVCAFLVEMHGLAAQLTTMPDLSDIVREGATVPLKVDPLPRLIILETSETRQQGNWAHHRQKLEDAGIFCVEKRL